MKDKGKMVNLEKKDEILFNSSSLMSLEDWDLAYNNNSLAKMQHKLQQKLSILNQRSQACFS